MQLSLFRQPCRRWPALLLLTLLAGCGGGGGGGGSSGGTATTTAAATTTTTTVATTTTTTAAALALPAGAGISGIVATGAPLLGATVRMVDAAGATVNFIDAGGNTVSTASTNYTDGGYQLKLTSFGAKLPALIQAYGVDMAGKPVVVHTRLAAEATPAVAHVTPATDAVVGMLLGANPAAVFQSAPSKTAQLALLGNDSAVANASDLVKSIIAANLTNAKVASAKTLDLFKDSTFTANKSGLDAALEELKIQIVKDSGGKDQLQFSNKFLGTGNVEVKVDLATAAAELAKSSGGSVAKAIVSTAKATTSPATALSSLATLDALGTTINKIINSSPGIDFTSLDTTVYPQLAPNYSRNNSYDATVLLGKFTAYATGNQQLGKLQVTGCGDEPPSSKGCVRVLVSTVVTDASGKVIDVINDAVQNTKAKPPTGSTVVQPDWTFVGNNKKSDFRVYPAAFATYGLDGAPASASESTTGSGVQVVFFSPDADPGLATARNVQMPNGHVVRFANCSRDYQCVESATLGRGELKDNLLQKSVFAWMGSSDLVVGAKYLLSVDSGATFDTVAYLPADVPSDLTGLPFPKLDDPSRLSPANILAGLSLSWKTWAAANPGMRVFLLRSAVDSLTADPQVRDASLGPTPATSASLPAIVLGSSYVPRSYQVWLGAEDGQGRRFFSKYASTP